MPTERLDQVLDRSPTSGSAAFAELDKLYDQILSTCPDTHLLLRVLGFSFIFPSDTRPPVTLSYIEITFNLRPGQAQAALRGIHSILHWRVIDEIDYEDEGSFSGVNDDVNLGLFVAEDISISPVHASLTDFLFDKERAKIFFIDKEKIYEDIFRHTLILFRDWNHRKTSFRYVSKPTLNNFTHFRCIPDITRTYTASCIQSSMYRFYLIFLCGIQTGPKNKF